MTEPISITPTPSTPPIPRGLVILLLATSAVLFLSVAGLAVYWYGKGSARPAVAPQATPSKQEPQSRFPEKPPSTPADETAGWQTYKSLEAGYSIRYPSSWTVNEWEKKFLTAIDNNVGVVVLTERKNNNYNAQLTISVSDTDTSRQLAKGGQEQGGEKLNLDGVEAFLWFQKNKSQALVTAIRGRYVYRLVLECLNQECYETKKDYYLNIFGQILSTFRFLDQKATVDCIYAKEAVISQVGRFEEYQKKRDALGVLSLFTPPEYPMETERYNFLSGKDSNAAPRLYSSGATNFNLLSYRVVSNPELRGSAWCAVGVEEERQYYRQGIGGYYEPRKVVVEILFTPAIGGDWKVDQYITLGQSTPSKYSAWPD